MFAWQWMFGLVLSNVVVLVGPIWYCEHIVGEEDLAAFLYVVSNVCSDC